jgi:hypothetical protein
VKNPTSGGRTEDKRKEFYSAVPCPLLEQLIGVYQMDLDLFEYDAQDFRRLCKKAEKDVRPL